LHNEELYTLYSSPNTVSVIKSKRIKGTGCVVGYKHVRDEKCALED
jgi:hypothetical protein